MTGANVVGDVCIIPRLLFAESSRYLRRGQGEMWQQLMAGERSLAMSGMSARRHGAVMMNSWLRCSSLVNEDGRLLLEHGCCWHVQATLSLALLLSTHESEHLAHDIIEVLLRRTVHSRSTFEALGIVTVQSILVRVVFLRSSGGHECAGMCACVSFL